MAKEKTSTQLRKLIASGETFVKPGSYDCLSAMVLERAGFKAIGTSGYAISTSLLGKPDLGFFSLNDAVDVCHRITNAISVPLIADADTGYGNAINAMRTVQEFIETGAAGIHIEDQQFPKRCGHIGGKTVISKEEMCGKIRACCRVRDEMDKDFVLIVRCDVRGTSDGSLEKLIDRCNAYVDAGADVIFPEAIPSEEELVEVARKVRAPLHYNRSGFGISPIIPLKRLQEIGNIAMTSDPTGIMRAALEGMSIHAEQFMADDADYLNRFKARIGKKYGSLHCFTNLPYYLELEKEFLPAEDLKRYEGSLGWGASVEI